MTRAALTGPDRGLRWLLLALAGLLLWDAGGLDLPLARLFGDASGFPLRDNAFLGGVMHDGMRTLSWLVVGWLLIGIAWPTGLQRGLPREERVRWALATALAALAVSLVKSVSHTSCPWDLAEFGGVAQYVPHWRLGLRDGGHGHCFPAGHSSSGFAHLAGWFALQRHAPRAARWWLLGALVAGLTLGLVQQVRGAHYMSHTLWAAWVCAAVAWGVHRLPVAAWIRRPGRS